MLGHLGGHLLLAAGNLGGYVAITVSPWVVGPNNPRAALRGIVEQALTDFGFTGTVE